MGATTVFSEQALEMLEHLRKRLEAQQMEAWAALYGPEIVNVRITEDHVVLTEIVDRDAFAGTAHPLTPTPD